MILFFILVSLVAVVFTVMAARERQHTAALLAASDEKFEEAMAAMADLRVHFAKIQARSVGEEVDPTEPLPEVWRKAIEE